ncbi:hypothetical protein LRD69_13130 [Streptomyces sp. JH14]|uniref:hypothetical protein n=1 Tax=Streptomyces sp. JH14 TaxID=2793630 RepID=UPI0023F7F3A6|nr:hypothetical protein [Streptomyces sp. JH14]MDF6043076.1 hypothetical protein [Streptomyces sp. JH14]
MGDTLLALSVPVLVLAAGIHAGCETWWRRRIPAPPSLYTHQAARLADRETVAAAEEIVDGAYATLKGFYGVSETTVPGMGATSVPGAPGFTPGAVASPGHGRSQPASARRG